jgi:hypothetical protein
MRRRFQAPRPPVRELDPGYGGGAACLPSARTSQHPIGQGRGFYGGSADLTLSLSPGSRSAVMVILSAPPRSSSSSGSAHHNGLRLLPLRESNPFSNAIHLSARQNYNVCLRTYLQTGCPFTSARVFPAGQPGLFCGGAGFAAAGAAEGGGAEGAGLIPACVGCSRFDGGAADGEGLIAACEGRSWFGGGADLIAARSGCSGCGGCGIAAFGGFVSVFSGLAGGPSFTMFGFCLPVAVFRGSLVRLDSGQSPRRQSVLLPAALHLALLPAPLPRPCQRTH